MRSVIACLAAFAVTMAGCSDSGTLPEPVAPDTTSPVSTVATTISSVDHLPVATVGVAAPTPLRVELTLAAEPSGLQVDMGVGGDPVSNAVVDPFGTFSSCSGGRRAFGAYSVLVSSLDGPVGAVTLLTHDSVTGAGIYDADVTVEMRAAKSQFATGTMTIAPGLRSGSYLAFAPDGGKLSGTFECSGGDADPAPLLVGADDGVLDTVEVFALLRRGESERVVGLAVQIERSPEIDAECPAVLGVVDPLVVRVDGDSSIGALESFDLRGGEVAAMRLSVAGATYEFDDVVVTVDGAPTAGTFSGSVDGLTVDGAFRCT